MCKRVNLLLQQDFGRVTKNRAYSAESKNTGNMEGKNEADNPEEVREPSANDGDHKKVRYVISTSTKASESYFYLWFLSQLYSLFQTLS